MIVSINQPAYLPWLGYLYRIAVSDVHVILDSVQFEKNSFINRNKIRTKDGWAWLTVPLKTKGKFGDLAINNLEIANETQWMKKHWSTIKFNYGKARYFAEHEPFFSKVYSQRWERLFDMAHEITRYLLAAFQINTPTFLSSEKTVSGKKDELVLELCKEFDADVYLSGPLGRDYLRESIFEASNIKVIYDQYQHPIYSQTYDGFEPYMSAIDLLFNHGPDSYDILMKNQAKVVG